MRTRSRKIVVPGTSCGRANTTDHPRAPTLDDTVAALVNVNAGNAHILQTWAQYGVPVTQGRPDPEADNTYVDFLKTNPPIFLRAEEPLEVVDWI